MYDKWNEVTSLINDSSVFVGNMLTRAASIWVTYVSHEPRDAGRQCNWIVFVFLVWKCVPWYCGVVEDSWRCWMLADHTSSDSRAEAGGLARSGDGNDLMFSTSEYLSAIIAYKSSHHRPQVKTINHSTQLIIQINRQGIICTSSHCICLRLAWRPSRVGLDSLTLFIFT